MVTKLFVIIVVIAFDSRFLDGSVHSLDLPIRPWMVNFGEAVFNLAFSAPHLKHMCHVPSGWPIAVARSMAEPDAIVGEDRMDFVAHCLHQSL